MDQLGQNFKIDFLLFLKWLFFQFDFGAKILKLDIVFSVYGNVIDNVITDLILRKRRVKFGNLGKVMAFIAI